MRPGLAPEVRHREQGALVLDFIDGRTFAAEDVRDPANLDRLAALLRRCHREVPQHYRGPAPIFWVFHVLRDYAHTLARGRQPLSRRPAAARGGGERLERAVGPVEIVFGHNDLLAAELHRRRRAALAGRLGLCRASTRRSSISAASRPTASCSPPQREALLEAYFGRGRSRDELRHRYAAMTAASLLRETMWSMVSEVHSTIDFDYAAYTAENLRAVRGGLAAFEAMERDMTDLPSSAKSRHHRRRHRRLLDRLSPRQDGLADVLLLERAKLSSGSTWHAAGLVGQLRTSANITQLLGYSVALYDRLEAETGLATGWKRNGGLRLACNAERWTEVKRQATTAHSFGLEMHLLSPKEAQELWPLMTVDDVVGAAFLPTDGQAEPVRHRAGARARARAARRDDPRGRRRHRHPRRGGRVRGVETDQGFVACEKVVICAGQWSRAIGRMAGVNVPLVSVQHQYLITERDPRASRRTCRRCAIPDRLTYYKEEVGGLVMGGYEPNPIPWAERGHPGRLPLHAARRRLGPFRRRSWSWRCRASRRSRRPASSSSSTARRASRRTATSSSARRRR